jgi:hypothetical protein
MKDAAAAAIVLVVVMDIAAPPSYLKIGRGRYD